MAHPPCQDSANDPINPDPQLKIPCSLVSNIANAPRKKNQTLQQHSAWQNGLQAEITLYCCCCSCHPVAGQGPSAEMTEETPADEDAGLKTSEDNAWRPSSLRVWRDDSGPYENRV